MRKSNRDASRYELQMQQEERFRRILRKWVNTSRGQRVVVIGDLNLDFLRWANPEPHLVQMVDSLKEKIETIGFQQLITEFTRTWNQQADSALDHIWTNCQERTLRTWNLPRTSSDHNIIGIDISLRDIKLGGHNIVKIVWKNFVPESFLSDLKTLDWSKILELDNVDLANSLLEDNLSSIIEKHAPMKTIQARTHYKNWLSDPTKTLMNLRDSAKEKARQSGTEEDWMDFRRQRNQCTAEQKRDKQRHLTELFNMIEDDKDSGKIFATTKELLGMTKTGHPSYFKVEGKTTFKQQELAEWQADWFQTKLKIITISIPQVCFDPLQYLKKAFNEWDPPGDRPVFKFRSVTLSEVDKMLRNLKNGHAYGRDGLDSFTVKLAGPVILPAITHVINLSLGAAVFPSKWKLARIVPILKSRGLETSHPSSFHPICQLSVMSKLTERSAQSQLLNYLEHNGLLHISHHAYRRKYSTMTALTQLMDAIASSTDANKITATMTLDLSAAFDCVRHSLLLEKLHYYGLDDHSIEWIRSYLDARSSYVTIGSARSSIRSTPLGVPQGSVLGPLLYLLYVNEMPSVINDDLCPNPAHGASERLFCGICPECGTFPMYADDGQYQTVSNSRDLNQDKLEKNFWKLGDFLNSNGLQINQSKTVLCEFMSHQKRAKTRGIPPDLMVREETTNRMGQKVVQDKLITDKTHHRMLGLVLQNNLAWDAHLSKDCKATLPAVRKQLGYLYRLRPNISNSAFLLLVNSLAMSKLSYGLSIWGNTTKNHIKAAQTVQNMAARMVTRMRRTTRQADLIKECGWLDMVEWTQYHSLLQMWKTVWWGIPTYLSNLISKDQENYITTQDPRLNMTKLAYRWKTTQSWNQLSQELRQETNLSRFKTGLRKAITESRNDNDNNDSGSDVSMDNSLQLGRPPDDNQ